MPSEIDWAVEMLRGAKTVGDIEQIIRGSARAAVTADGATVVRREGDDCFYSQEDSVSPLWQGQRLPVTECISGWAMLNRKTVAIGDVTVDDRIPQRAYRPTFVHSLLMVPIGLSDPVGAIGAYWADRHVATAVEQAALERLASAAAEAYARVRADPHDVDRLIPT